VISFPVACACFAKDIFHDPATGCQAFFNFLSFGVHVGAWGNNKKTMERDVAAEKRRKDAAGKKAAEKKSKTDMAENVWGAFRNVGALFTQFGQKSTFADFKKSMGWAA
jgi:hypothetical protein